MILAFALVQAQLAVPPARRQAETQEEVVVIAQRLADWRNRMRELPDGSIQCTTVRSSGDREVDQLGCSAMVHCYTQLRPAFVSASQQRRGRRMPAAGHPLDQQLSACVRDQHDRLTAALAERRYQARHGTNDAQD